VESDYLNLSIFLLYPDRSTFITFYLSSISAIIFRANKHFVTYIISYSVTLCRYNASSYSFIMKATAYFERKTRI